MHIKRFRNSIDQAHLSIYKDLHIIKCAKKSHLNDYSHKMISSISRLQDKSSEVAESNIQYKSSIIYSWNLTATSDTLSFSTSCSTSPYNNQITTQKVSTFLMGGHNTQKIMNSNETHLKVSISDSIIYEGVYLSLNQKPRFKKILDLVINVSKGCQTPN